MQIFFSLAKANSSLISVQKKRKKKKKKKKKKKLDYPTGFPPFMSLSNEESVPERAPFHILVGHRSKYW
jgi:hypothetical protein